MNAPVLVGPSPDGGGPAPAPHRARHLVQRPLEPRAHITRRQIDILRLAANGSTNRAIAHQLGVSEETIKTQLQVAYRKLRTRDRTQAVTVALRLGLLSLDDIDVPAGANSGYRHSE
ncbi:LuxR C-terminal-related transcriptional regulator [Streptomyces sp. NBRC 110035]|uniref:helix-turn-helix domain-containing protein n=1 Tax=Streptomyces sp. NBRC 110035 TaxID=1547867 RepID=UPI00131C7D73|nr:LuxR C-terminal-related transcriptional regulator [Streptomyces sp. NBRC 110035]